MFLISLFSDRRIQCFVSHDELESPISTFVQIDVNLGPSITTLHSDQKFVSEVVF